MSAQNTLFVTYPTLSAPASGDSTLVQLYPLLKTQNYTFFATVADINTNVVVALNGSIDGTNWSKIIANQTISKYIQPIFVSETGGTAATVTFSIGASS